MKPTRLQRAWSAWLALPEVARIAAVITVVVLIGWLLPRPAQAEEAILRSGENWLRLMDTPCTHGETLGRLLPEWREKFRNARAQINGKSWYACWIAKDDGSVHVLFEDGDESDFQIAQFKPDYGV